MFDIVGVYKVCILCVCLCLVCFADAIIASTCGGQATWGRVVFDGM